MTAFPLLALVLSAPADPPAAPKILARGVFNTPAKPGAEPVRATFRTEDEFNKAFGDSAKTILAGLLKKFKRESIDWSKEAVVVVTDGVKKTGGYRVGVRDLTLRDGTLVVAWWLQEPDPAMMVTQGLTHPGEALLTEALPAKVTFEKVPPPAPKKP